MGDIVFTLAEVAEKLKISTRTVRRELKKGRLVGVQVGGRLMVTPSALEQYLATPIRNGRPGKRRKRKEK